MAVAPELSGHLHPPDMVDLQHRSMWPATTQALVKTDKRGQPLQPTVDLKQLLQNDNTYADPQKFEELMRSSKGGISHRDSLARLWKDKQANAVGLLRDELNSLQQRRIESERKKNKILDEHRAEQLYSRPDVDEDMSDPVRIGEGFICDEGATSWSSIPDSASSLSEYEVDNSSGYWREMAKALDTLLSESLKREEALSTKLQEHTAAELPSRLAGEIQEQFERFDNFLRFCLRKAPVVIGHQDTELRYRFVHNAFPTLTEEEVIGKTDEEISQGMGVSELMELKREVIRTKVPDNQEIKFNTNLFGVKTFMIAVDPVLDTNDVCVGVNYVAMDVTLQVAKREKLAQIQAEEAVQIAMKSELNKTIYITEEIMRAKQMLATMSHEIRSPLSGVISMASVLARTPLNKDQELKVEFMIKSGNVVLQLINDILDLSKVEAGAMTFEAKKFRPREVVRHVLQMASASVAADNKVLQLEGDVSDDVPLEVVGDVLRIRQVLTNLVSNSVKFTHEGKVSIVVRVVGPSSFTAHDQMKPKRLSECDCDKMSQQSRGRSTFAGPMIASFSSEVPRIIHINGLAEWLSTPVSSDSVQFSESSLTRVSPNGSGLSSSGARKYQCSDLQNSGVVKPSNSRQRGQMAGDAVISLDKQQTGLQMSASSFSSRNAGEREALGNMDEDVEDIAWLEFHIIDTGIGITESAIPTLFKRYAQASRTHARKYGGTGLGLHICKQLVELMGGSISVLSKEKEGSTFSFKLPLRTVKQLPSSSISSDEPEHVNDEDNEGFMYTEVLGSLQFSSKKAAQKNYSYLPSRVHVRRRSKSYQFLRAANTPSRMSSHRGNSSTAHLSQKRELLLSTVSTRGVEPASAIETHPVQFEEYGNCLNRPNSSAHLDSQGASLHASCQCVEGFDKDDAVKSLHRSNASSEKVCALQNGGPAQKCVHYKMRSPPGQGSTRKMGKTQSSDRRAAREPSSATSKGLRNARRFRVLVAEDDPVNVKVSTQMMSALGHELTVVNNGADAVQAIEQGSYDVVLMDVHMPGMDGLEATRLIRRYEETGPLAAINGTPRAQQGATAATNAPSHMGLRKKRRIPIIAMTADALADNAQECARHGMDNFIAKPVNLEKLEELLNQYVPTMDNKI